MPKSRRPALFETTVRFFVPARRTAAIRFSGMPHSAEAAHQNRGAVAQARNGGIGIGYSFIHEVLLKSH